MALYMLLSYYYTIKTYLLLWVAVLKCPICGTFKNISEICPRSVYLCIDDIEPASNDKKVFQLFEGLNYTFKTERLLSKSKKSTKANQNLRKSVKAKMFMKI